MRIIFEIPPNQEERITSLLQHILKSPMTFIACALALAVPLAALAAVVYFFRF